jgi:hypothetical protein
MKLPEIFPKAQEILTTEDTEAHRGKLRRESYRRRFDNSFKEVAGAG